MATTKEKVKARRFMIAFGAPMGIIAFAMFKWIRLSVDLPASTSGSRLGYNAELPQFVRDGFLPLDLLFAVGCVMLFSYILHLSDTGQNGPNSNNGHTSLAAYIAYASKMILGAALAAGSMFGMIGAAFFGWYSGIMFMLITALFFVCIGTAVGLVALASYGIYMLVRAINGYTKRKSAANPQYKPRRRASRWAPVASQLRRFNSYMEADDKPDDPK